ncbi:MAG: flagellar biosynthesis anti-sigma factor FlgM [Bryobacter sp.]|nr:flagellar biosynthesis anti-sigma factor FlgM [Bryobacter sp.]
MKVPDQNLSASQISANQLQEISRAGAANQQATAKAKAAGENSPLARPDSVELSTLSSKINELQSGSPEREAYLERLAATYAAGEYNADPAALATSLVDNALAEDPASAAAPQGGASSSPVIDAYRNNS